MNCIISIGVEKAEWRAGEMQSTPIGTPRASAISGDTFAAGSTPPWPGLAPWTELDLDHLDLRRPRACAANCSGSKLPSALRQPK